MSDSPSPNDASPPPAEPAAAGLRQTAAGGWRGVAVQTAQALRFYSRLPVPGLPFEPDPHAVPDFATLPRILPLAGALVGLAGAAALVVGHAVGLAPGPAAAVAVAVLVIVTGCFGEDGLADAADGLYGGATVERRLEIMRDSRVGSYGVAAIALSLILRVTALASLVASHGSWPAALALVATGGVSRVAGVVPLWALPPARADGRSAAVGRPGETAMRTAMAGALGLAALLLVPPFGLGRALLALAAAALAALAVTRLARHKLGGQTGDMAGATQQAADVLMLLALATGSGA
ncbi:MAG: adenosylcobinamide-GDP ribazoletransferase [Alsobacter sp.]